MSYLSVDNLIGVLPTTTSSVALACQSLDIYNGTINYHRITSSAASPLMTISIPNASGTLTLNTATQTITNKMNHAQVGSATDPSFSFIGNTNMGLFRSAVNTIGVTTAGVSRITISDTTMVNSLPYLSSNTGTAGNVAVGYGSGTSSGTGIFWGLNRMDFSTNSVSRLYIQDTAITASQPIVATTGTSAACAIQFPSSTGTGFHNTGGLLYASLGGTNLIRLQSGQIFSDGAHKFATGTAATPSIGSTTYTTTGIYWTATPTLGVAVSGAQAAGFVSGGMTLYGSTAGNNALYSPSTLGYYQEFSITGTWYVQGTTSNGQAGNIYFTRIGRMINMVVDAVAGNINNNTGVAQTQLYFNTSTPTQTTSTLTNQSGVCRVTWNTFQCTALCYVATNTVYITVIPSTVLNNGQNATFNTAFCVSWTV